MKKVIFGTLILLFAFLLAGCVEITSNPEDLFGYWDSKLYSVYTKFDEGGTYHSDYYYVSSDIEKVKVVVNPTEVPWYGFEIWIMSEAQYQDFSNNDVVNAVAHWSAFDGYQTFTCSLPSGFYRVLLDNSDRGWNDTDFDGVNDYVYTDLEWLFYERY